MNPQPIIPLTALLYRRASACITITRRRNRAGQVVEHRHLIRG